MFPFLFCSRFLFLSIIPYFMVYFSFLSYLRRHYLTKFCVIHIAKRNIKSVISPKRNKLEQRNYKGFGVLKKRDSSLTVNFIALDMLLRILSLLLNVGTVLPLDMLKCSMVSSLLYYFRFIFMYL